MLLVFHPYVLSESNVMVIQNGKIAYSEFSQRVGINQETLLWPLKRCPQIISDETKGILRSKMELVIICNALKRAGFKGNIQIVLSGNSQRQKIELAKGKADLLGHSVFSGSFNQTSKPAASSFLLTEPVIKKGQYFVGVFTSANQLKEVTKAFQNNNHKSLVATTVSTWEIDVKTLREMKVKSLHLLPKHDLIPSNLKRKRANFTLASLEGKNTKKSQLKRINGYKVSLADERVFVVNKKSSYVFKALQEYLLYLRNEDDLLTKAYEHADVFSNKYHDWILIK